ncbi:MAG: hypothetical protein HZB24_05600 [Desulfobacterales bacterium]|nr:hypothetical protein [Desulfobacterales bacterium]
MVAVEKPQPVTKGFGRFRGNSAFQRGRGDDDLLRQILDLAHTARRKGRVETWRYGLGRHAFDIRFNKLRRQLFMSGCMSCLINRFLTVYMA